MADLGARPILPQGSRAISFSSSEPREKQKNYVFVDEHNRHRRLKVMRACGACRRRKIKCDAATTNTWPCAACVKQQLECVPPSSDKDGGFEGDDSVADSSAFQSAFGYDASGIYDPSTYQESPGLNQDYNYSLNAAQNTAQGSNSGHLSAQGNSWTTQGSCAYPYPTTTDEYGQSYQSRPFQPSFQPPSLVKSASVVSGGSSWTDQQPDSELSDAMQDLKIDRVGVAPYIANQRILAEGPAVEEVEIILPPQGGPNQTVGIPPEMMPSDAQAMQYFELFFTNINPYVPVLNRSYFYRQWSSDKFLISPLVLEGVFACSAQMLGHTEERARWLALAARHEENFKDVPRLSTLQGLVLVLKAREAVPKRGYYYRSWTTIQYLIAMAKDLELDQHSEAHVKGQPCGTTGFECAVKTRIWNSLFQLELMVGGPQGRHDFAVDIATIDTSTPVPIPGVEEAELRISQDQTQFVRAIMNVRTTSRIYWTLKKQNINFAEDPEFVRHNAEYDRWSEGVPRHLQVTYKPDGSAPWIPFHFAANLHAYHLLGVIMHHRPQLDLTNATVNDNWRSILVKCTTAATQICRLHESILQTSGLRGLLCMMRGINTAIYAILTCTMLHLVAITAPDHDINENARDYFTRHMRILEQCSSSWPMPAMQLQINSLREAFSADLTKPFELRRNFPYGSPKQSDASSPPSDSGYASNVAHADRSGWSSSYGTTTPITPPATANAINISGEYATTSAGMTSQSTYLGGPSAQQAAGSELQWDPSGVFDRWNTAFNTANLDTTPSPGIPPSMQPASVALNQTPIPMFTQQQIPTTPVSNFSNYGSQARVSPPYNMHVSQPPQQQTFIPPQSPMTAQPYSAPIATSASAQQPFVTPSMWQDAVARSYGEGLKRRYDDNASGSRQKRTK